MTTIDTSQVVFRTEYEQELEAWLRRRFRNLCITYLALSGLLLLNYVAAFPFGGDAPLVRDLLVPVVQSLLYAGVASQFLFVRQKTLESRSELLRAASQMMLAVTSISLLGAIAHWLLGGSFGYDIVLSVFFWHFTACLFLPWTAWESVRPVIPVLTVWAVMALTTAGAGIAGAMLMVISAPLFLLPGLLICALRLERHRHRFRAAMFGRYFKSMRRELDQARSIHESLFPESFDDGYVQFDYVYTPMRDLGGDFITIHVASDGLVHATLIDVTGHGLGAALTVNRLYGELARIRGESPEAEPAEVIALLNRYIHLTMSPHNLYATALHLVVDPCKGQVRWASAGHPPAFLRGANVAVTALNATAVLLGAVPDAQFDANQQSLDLTPGDVILLYTDGAFEARDRAGTKLGLDRLRQTLRVQPPPGRWAQFIASLVNKHNAGRAEDDVLIATLTFRAYRPSSRPAARSVATT